MDVRVLGPFTAQLNGASILPAAGKQRQILALLALAGNGGVTVADLIQELWGMNPPRSAHNTLQTYILRLRRRLDAALYSGSCGISKQVLVTFLGGYRLNLKRGELDSHEFDRRIRVGRTAAEAGDDEAASRIFDEALAQWSGPALADVPLGCCLATEARRLNESRMAAMGQRLEADLRLGRHHLVLGQLAGLVAHHPVDENLHALRMIALYRSGRAGDALHVFNRLRSSLVEDLGLEPSHRLQRLQRAVLMADPALDSRECLISAFDRAQAIGSR